MRVAGASARRAGTGIVARSLSYDGHRVGAVAERLESRAAAPAEGDDPPPDLDLLAFLAQDADGAADEERSVRIGTNLDVVAHARPRNRPERPRVHRSMR